MKLVIGGVAQGKLDYVLENMIEESEKYDVYDCFFLKDNACNDKASNMEWPWDFAVDDESAEDMGDDYGGSHCRFRTVYLSK